jgi:hypothetical protein
LIHARNNVWAGTDYALNNYNTGQPVDLDYDDLWNGNSGDLVRWDGVSYASLAAFSAATGQEPHALSLQPGFADAGGGDYTLDPASDLIDAGLVIPGINDDYVGDAPDVGAFEVQGYGFTLEATPALRFIQPGGVATYTLSVGSLGGFAEAVGLIAASPSPSLTLSLVPNTVSPPGEATLTVTDSLQFPGNSEFPGNWRNWASLRYTLPITATGGGITQSTSVSLLVGGAYVYLPVVLRQSP